MSEQQPEHPLMIKFQKLISKKIDRAKCCRCVFNRKSFYYHLMTCHKDATHHPSFHRILKSIDLSKYPKPLDDSNPSCYDTSGENRSPENNLEEFFKKMQQELSPEWYQQVCDVMFHRAKQIAVQFLDRSPKPTYWFWLNNEPALSLHEKPRHFFEKFISNPRLRQQFFVENLYKFFD